MVIEALKQSFMECQLSSTSKLPGIWVIEMLAHSNQVDISLLLDLLEKTPQISDDLGKNARELVSLRILQSSLFQGTSASSVSSASSQKITLDPSGRCEDVLRQILAETPPSHLKPAEPDVWKWDLEPFIENKRSSLGKYALQQLKDAILTGSYSSLSSLKEQSGLLVGNGPEHGALADDVNCNGITSRREGGDKNGSYVLHRDLPNKNFIPVKRKRAINKTAGDSCENQTHIESVKKYRQDTLGSEECVGGKVISSGIDTRLAGTSRASIQHSEGERCSLGRETHVGGLGLNGRPENDNSKRTSSNELVSPDNVFPGKYHVTEEAKGDQEGICDLETTNEDLDRFERNMHRNVSNGSQECALKGPSSPDLPHEKQAPHCGTEVPNEKLDGEQRQEQDHDGVNAEDYKKGSHGLETTIEEQNIERSVPIVGEANQVVDISSDSEGCHDERTSIDTKKKMFLSSQCTYSEDSLATTDWRELNLCVKCNKGGKLLVCSSDSCPLVIHESCLGSDARFDAKGKFYCPFCAYSRAISNYMEIKRKTSVARKDLATFICLATRKESKKQSRTSFRIQQNHSEQDDGLPKCNELNKRDNVKEVNNHQRRKRLEYEKAKRDNVKEVNNHQRRKRFEYEEAGPSEINSGYAPRFGGKAVDLANRAPETLASDKQERKRTRQVSQSPRVHGQDQMAALATHKSQGENKSCKVVERNNERENHPDMRSKKGVLCPPDTDVNRCSPSTQSDAEEMSEEENDNSGASKYFIRGRKLERELSYPAIPQSRRKRIQWTTAEEETLKEGMRLFCSPHDKIIPWKKILEFGTGIFQQSRTTMDLKDKWRNMSKATPKS